MVLVIRLAITAFAIWLAARWVDGIDIIYPKDKDDWWEFVVLAGIASWVAWRGGHPDPRLYGDPAADGAMCGGALAMAATTGLLRVLSDLLVINGLMLMLTAKITETTEYGLRVDGFWTAVWGALVISIVNWLLGVLVPDGKD